MKKDWFLSALLALILVWAWGFGAVNADTSDFMHYTTDTITICDPEDSTKCITMMDRNLWATKAGTWCSATDTWACGNHFQRWNNYWFAPNFSWNDSFPNGETSTTNERVDTTWYWPWNFYSGNIFRKIISSPYDWRTTRNDNLRWWAEDKTGNNRWYDIENNVAYNVVGRQWPCSDWYHVPSAGEWNAVLKYWAWNYTWAWNSLTLSINSTSQLGSFSNATARTQFQEDFKIPFAGNRYYNNAQVNDVGSYASLRSSSPIVGNRNAHYFNLRPNVANANTEFTCTNAYSVRCFKDSALSFPSVASQVVFWTGEAAGEPACSGEVLSWEVVSWALLACVQWLWDSKQWYTLSGWRDVETDTVWTLDTPVVTWLTLQAVWTPDTDSNNNWTADEEESFTITREDGDGNFVWSGEFAYGTSPAFGGIQPEKTGYTFSSRDPAVQSVTGDFTYIATWTANEYSITFRDWSWTETDVVWTGEYNTPVTVSYPSWTKTGYTGARDTTIPTTFPAENTVITMNWTANEYTITFDTDGWSAISPITAPYNAPVSAPANPTKAGAVFDSWSPAFPATMPLGWATLKAIWRNALSGGWSAWWGWVKKEIDDCPNGDYSSSYYDWTCGSKDSSQAQNDGKGEFQTAYERAYENEITTMDTVEKADLNWNLTRIAMAKMLSKYAINVLWKKPVSTIVPKFNDVSGKLDAQYDNGVSLAYQLWIMWINMPNNNFRPFDLVSRAEFVTALSRMRYGTPDGEYAGTAEYYKNHMEILSDKWIVSLLDPEMLELRGYVMVMLMRSR